MNISKDDAINIIVNFIYGDKLYPIITTKKLTVGKEMTLRYNNSKFWAYPVAKYKVNSILLSQWLPHRIVDGTVISSKGKLYILRVSKVKVKDIDIVREAYDILKKKYNCGNENLNDCLTVKFLNS